MAYIGDENNDKDKDKPQSKLADLIAAAQGLKVASKPALSRLEQTIISDTKRWKAALGAASACYDSKLFQDSLNARRMIEQVAFPSSLHYAQGLSHYADTLAGLAAQASAAGIPKYLLDSQLDLQSCVEGYKSALDSALASLPSNRDISINDPSVIQKTWEAAGITGAFFQDSCSEAIRAISESCFPSQNIMAESVRHVLESAAFKTATLSVVQGLSKDILANGQAIIDHRHFAFEAGLIQKAIAPFVREWGWLVCEAKLVSVDIAHDGDRFLYAEYNRETVVELLTARLALEGTQPEVSIGSSGELAQAEGLFECSGEHSSHSAHYQGETVLETKDEQSMKKALAKCLEELRQNSIFDEDDWDQIEIDARYAEKFVRENFGKMMHVGLLYLMELSVLYVRENPISAEEFRAHQEKALARLRELLPKLDGGRPEGTGLFKNIDDFQTALKDVLEKAQKKPTQIKALHALRQHPLCQIQTTELPTQDQTKTMRNWLTKCGMTYKEALQKYWEPAQKGK